VQDATFRNVKAARLGMYGHDVSVLGGEFGPIDNASTAQVAPTSPSASQVPTNVLIDGASFHGAHMTDGVTHVDCLHSWGVNGLTIRNSRFYDCEHFDILFTTDSVLGSPTNVLIENNFFDCCRSGYYAVYLGDGGGDTWKNITVRNNSSDKDFGIGPRNTTGPNVQFSGNIAPGFDGCGRSGVSVDYNVWYAGSRCGSHDKVAASGFVDPAGYDFHLRSGAAAIDSGNPASFPTSDIDGDARPRGSGPDAGADESGAIAGPTTLDTQSPTTPSGLASSGSSGSSISLSWVVSSDNVGVAGYTVYNGAATVGTTTSTSFTVSGLSCGTPYSLAVDAFDAAGNRSGRAALTVSTSACADSSPPTTPGYLVVSSASASSLTLSWNASLDNVGVAGYTVYNGASTVATTQQTSYTVSGLSCGSSYTLAVDAYDAAGNRSTKASVTSATSACPAPPPPGSAGVFLAPGGSDGNPCTQTQPCLSFDRGYHAATAGQTVEVAAGSYGDQTINDDPSKDGSVSEVLLRPASGATVTITDLLSYASNVHYKDFTVSTATAGQPDIRAGHDVIVENVKASNFYIQGPTSNVTFKGGDYGPYPSCGGGSQIKTLTNGGDDPNTAAQPKNTIIDGVYLHDYTIPGSCPTAHLDCLHIFYHAQITIRNSTFIRCAHYGILFDSNGAGAAENDLIENNFFGTAGVAGFALRGGTDEYFDTVTVRYNSGDFITPQTTQAQLTNIKWYANISAAAPPCRPGIDYQYNIAPDGTCSSTDLQAPTGFTNPSTGDYHLSSTAPAIGRAKPGDYPTNDHDQQQRPQGTPDAGADER
jgi:chitodextrinase